VNKAFVIDNGRCIGCHACSTACKSENQVAVGVHRTWVKYVEQGQYPDVRRHFQVTRCNHCANPPCVRICPTAAMFQRSDGIVEFDSDACIGCKGCMQACPYDAIHIDPETHTAAKCHMCAHRVDVGLEPACVVVCPEHAILFGDIDDPTSEISKHLSRRDATVRKPEQGTSPKVFYIHGTEVNLRPGVAQRASQGMWGDVVDDHATIGDVGTSSAPLPGTSSHPRTEARTGAPQGLPEAGPLNLGGRMSEHMVQEAFNVQHKVPWHWPIAVYVTTKHLAGGIAMVLAALALTPSVALPSSLMAGGGVLALIGLAVTLGLLIYDLERPDRFFFLLVRPQWRSWIARAAWILTSFNVVFGGWWFASLAFGPLSTGAQAALALATLPLGWLTATYTAFLFAQAEGRDLWQAPHMPAVLTAQALGLGATALAALGFLGTPDAVQSILLGIGSIGLLAGGLIQLAGDATTPASENGRRALESLNSGHYKAHYWGGLALGALVPAAATALGLPALALPVACVGITIGAWAWLEAPQQIPNS